MNLAFKLHVDTHFIPHHHTNRLEFHVLLFGSNIFFPYLPILVIPHPRPPAPFHLHDSGHFACGVIFKSDCFCLAACTSFAAA